MYVHTLPNAAGLSDLALAFVVDAASGNLLFESFGVGAEQYQHPGMHSSTTWPSFIVREPLKHSHHKCRQGSRILWVMDIFLDSPPRFRAAGVSQHPGLYEHIDAISSTLNMH